MRDVRKPSKVAGGPRRRRVESGEISDAVLLQIVSRFLDGEGADDIAKWLEESHGLKIGRERVYSLLGVARKRELFRLQVRDASRLASKVAKALSNVPSDRVHVVPADQPEVSDQVAYRAAEVALRILRDLENGIDPSSGRRVRIGLGGGRTMRLLAGHLAALLRKEQQLPPIAFHALSSGFDVRKPQNAPITFLGLFDHVGSDVEMVGLFSSGVIHASEIKSARNLPGVGESFALAPEIDLIITSLASADDRQGALRRFLDHGGVLELTYSRDILMNEKWVGDVLYEPYSNIAPIEVDLPVRAVSLFTLQELVDVAAHQRRRVLLVAGPSESGSSKANALRPLLTVPALRVWTDLVVDDATIVAALSGVADIR